MSANPGGGDHVPESPSEATMSNEHATIEALRAEVAQQEGWYADLLRRTKILDGLLAATRLKVEYWQDRALAAEADAATLSEKLAARATVRHNLDPTQP